MKEHRGSVVVVEDDYSVNHAISRLLEAAGFHALQFESAEALLNDNLAQTADCLILDIHLPGMSGFDLHKTLRERGLSAPVIVVTAHDDFQHRHRARAIGAVAYLTKPFTSAALIDAVRNAIENVSRSPKVK